MQRAATHGITPEEVYASPSVHLPSVDALLSLHFVVASVVSELPLELVEDITAVYGHSEDPDDPMFDTRSRN